MKTSLADDGYVVLKGVFSESELQALRSYVDRIVNVANKDGYDPFQSVYMRHRPDNGVLYDVYQRHPIFQDFAKNKRVLSEVGKVLGDDIYLYVNSLLYKPRDKGNEVPWHQDFMSRPGESLKIIAGMALDNASRENGCIKVLPGTHKRGFYEWYTVKGEMHHDRIRLDNVDTDNAVYLEVEAGDVVLFSQYLVHASDQNDSSLPRRAYRVVYKALDTIDIPRGAPIVLCGGDPERLDSKRAFERTALLKSNSSKKDAEVQKVTLTRRIVHKVGRLLLKF